MKSRILFVDDEPKFLSALRRMLRSQRNEWEMRFVRSADEALGETRQTDYDLIVSDANMPGKNGFEFLRELRDAENTSNVPVIVLTGQGEREFKRRALELGATDLLSKPVQVEDLLVRIRNVLRAKAYQDRLKHQNRMLDERVRERTTELEESHLDVVMRLAKAAEYRDEETGNHVLRVGCYCRILAEEMRLDAAFVERIFLTGPLHDIGKIGIADAILLKPEKLSAEEWETMKTHTSIGSEILLRDPHGMQQYLAERREGAVPETRRPENPVLKMAASIALTHHEQWNGGGYPQGLKGEEIPMEGRITALADVYDALLSDRPYKRAFPEEKVLAIMREEAGDHFDPDVYVVFEARVEEFRAIREQFTDQADATLASVQAAP